MEYKNDLDNRIKKIFIDKFNILVFDNMCEGFYKHFLEYIKDRTFENINIYDKILNNLNYFKVIFNSIYIEEEYRNDYKEEIYKYCNYIINSIIKYELTYDYYKILKNKIEDKNEEVKNEILKIKILYIEKEHRIKAIEELKIHSKILYENNDLLNLLIKNSYENLDLKKKIENLEFCNKYSIKN